MLLGHLLEQGLSKTAIARQLGLNRRTINRWIAGKQLDRDVETATPGPRLFTAPVAPVLRKAGADDLRRAGGGVRILRRRAARDPVRQDGQRHHAGSTL